MQDIDTNMYDYLLALAIQHGKFDKPHILKGSVVTHINRTHKRAAINPKRTAINRKRAKAGWIGVTFNEYLGFIYDIAPNSDLHKYGVQIGDQILKINGIPIPHVHDMLLDPKRYAGTVETIVIKHGQHTLWLTVKLIPLQ